MNDIQEIKKYVAEHIDEAIEREEIKVFYQPIVRTVTGKICEKEALSRWDSPGFGLLEPSQFIPVLEENKLIHKLDAFMIKKVCGHYNHCVNRNDPLVPISFNLSWQDFELCDIIGILNKEIEDNQVPREMVSIEINESLISHDRDLIRNKLGILHDLGYRIVMDDFGSGHSSVNILKDYVFDELKIDMKILWSRDDRAKKIIKHLCAMAKALDIITVAEGVEKEEQADFLFSVGCEKMQGYYFGKPMFYWDLVEYVKRKGLSMESLSLKGYYDVIGGLDIQEKAGTSYAIAEVIDNKTSFLYFNGEFRKNIESLRIDDITSLEDSFNETGSVRGERFLRLVEAAKKSREEEARDFVWKGSYCIARLTYLVGARGRDAVEFKLNNLSLNSQVDHLEKINSALNSVYSIFNRVIEVYPDEDRVRILYMNTPFAEKYEDNDIPKNMEKFIRKDTYPEDRERYRQFSDLKTLDGRISGSGRDFITGCFRFKNPGGSFAWMEQYIIPCADTGNGRRYLVLTKDVDEKQLAILMQLSSFISAPPDEDRSDHGDDITESILWRSVVEECPVGIFWKDKERRFLGVNKVFLDYYGFESVSEVLGKTDEDLNWHVDPEPFRRDEEKVLKNGEIIRDAIGKCISKGKNRDIIANKAPIHKDGKIVGLIGYFHDVTDVVKKDEALINVTLTDPVTGALNTLGLMDTAVRYTEAYEDNGVDYVMVAFNISRYRTIREEYGSEHCDMMMRLIADKIQKLVGVSGITSRPGSDIFVVMRQVDRPEEGHSIMQLISGELRKIREVNGVPCTIYTSAGYAAFSECRNTEALYSATVKRMNDQMERIRRLTGGY